MTREGAAQYTKNLYGFLLKNSKIHVDFPLDYILQSLCFQGFRLFE
jgi:hypothetical protein